MAMNVNSSGATRRGRRGHRRAPMAEINVTPFVDVMLVLLIIFMVTAPLLVSGVPVELPESSAKPLDQKDEPLDISIDKEGQVFLDSQPVSEGELSAQLEAIAAEQDPSNPRQIMLRGDTTISYGEMMKVMGELNRVGLNSVSLVTTAAAAPVTEGSSGEQ
ncbi:MAG: protein TolR [Sphingomonadales bacterium]|nr:protein TolR [Sphingomonadales bacterium]MBK9002630.1 protein TolR [Sphingomonadales bacterium]MBK9267851.1 protein TolR [Sphingomonadales bacterium]MBP6433892.1 protein TolR [Sphingorhabdus sp.]